LKTTGRDFAHVAHEAGYYDQSHFNKDFRRFTGQAPESFFGRIETREDAEVLQDSRRTGRPN
jgi:AraC-like DNA-binding protein